jgi:cell shape-determining protein MreC
MMFVWFMLAGFIILLAPQTITGKFQFVFAGLFRWPLSLSRSVLLHTRYQQLPPEASPTHDPQYRNYVANLVRQLEQQQQRFEKLAQIRDRLPLEGAALVLADVVTASIETTSCQFIINRGKQDGLAAGQFVLGQNSVIGTIWAVGQRQARVKLFTDPTLKLQVQIGRLPLARVMQGDGENAAKIPMVSARDYKVNVGDHVFVRKKPGLLGSPMIVGIVSQCEIDDQEPMVWDITVAPACDIDRLDTVAVIVMNPK